MSKRSIYNKYYDFIQASNINQFAEEIEKQVQDQNQKDLIDKLDDNKKIEPRKGPSVISSFLVGTMNKNESKQRKFELAPEDD